MLNKLSRLFFAFVTSVSAASFADTPLPAKQAPASAEAKPAAAKEDVPSLKPVSKQDVASLKALDQRYQQAKSIEMGVEKVLKLGLLGQERKASGKIWLSGGRVRMELEGAEKSLLVVNKKNLWAVTFPPAEFKDAAIQVIRGDTTTKKGRSQSIVSLLSLGGFLKFFTPTGMQALPSGETIYFLQPQKEQTDFKRAQVKVTKDKKTIQELRYWDERDNETSFEFKDVSFGKKVDEKLFQYDPPANADVMNL